MNTPLPNPNRFALPGASRPHPVQPQQQAWRPNIANTGPTRTQQMFRALPPNYNDRSDVFRLPPRNMPGGPGPQRPTPMSGVSHFVSKPMPFRGHDWAKSGNPPPSNYFKFRELNFNECPDYEYGPYYEQYEESYYNEQEYCDNLLYSDNNYNDQGYYTNVSPSAIEASEDLPPNNQEEDFQIAGPSTKPK